MLTCNDDKTWVCRLKGSTVVVRVSLGDCGVAPHLTFWSIEGDISPTRPNPGVGGIPPSRATCQNGFVKWSRFLIVLAFAAAVLGLGLATLLGAFGGGGHVATAAPPTTSTTYVTVPANEQNHHVVVPNVVGETQAQATATLAAAGLGTSARGVSVNDGTPVATVMAESPWQGSIVVPGSLVSITVAA
jgi:PASTA domain